MQSRKGESLMRTVGRKLLFSAVVLAAGALASPVLADSVSRTGPNGGQFQRQTSCAGGPYAGGCRTNWSYTGPQGRTFSGQRGTVYGPYRAAHYGSVTGPGGRTAYRGYAWRRY
jgi:hypothetical protein